MELWRQIDRAEPLEARRLLLACCGSARWVDRMLARRPFESDAVLHAAAHEEWLRLAPADWLEAFRAHPKIGDRAALRERFGATRHLSAQEQAGVEGTSDDVLAQLEAANREYESRFGYIFIVCATGKTAEEMLTILRQRLGNAPDAEIHVAAAEQWKITALRLHKGV